MAARWEAELFEGVYRPANKTTWKELRASYFSLHLSTLSKATAAKARATCNSFEQSQRPGFLSSITGRDVLEWQAFLRSQGRTENTVKSHSRHLKAFFRWAVSSGFVSEMPDVPMPKRATAQKMKGRPITEEEKDRYRHAAAEIVGEARAASWQHLIDGLWFSGLRLGEACRLTWHESPFCVDLLNYERPMFSIEAEAEKGFRNRLLPMSPEFSEFLGDPKPAGYVFNPAGKKGQRPAFDWIGKQLVKIGRASEVETQPGQFVKPHDLRRSFGFRWSRHVMPAVLKEIMRHDSIETTLSYYVGANAEDTARTMWRVHESAK
ncbi:tyrosine-type recombinase/integrase [Thalassoglobus polymorphus]|nr:site-specific integrase [Thalassoglobus polymorphus]